MRYLALILSFLACIFPMPSRTRMSSSSSSSASAAAADKKEEKDLFVDKAQAKLEEEDRKVKKTKDYLPEVKAALPEILKGLKASDIDSLQPVLTELLVWEKKTRLAADGDSTKMLAEAILDACFTVHNWVALGEHVSLLYKRRAQLVKVMKAVTVHAMAYISKAPTAAAKKDLINVLRDVTAGKIFVEQERAQLTMLLAQMSEAEGNISEAADLLQEIAVETIGAMTLKEKAEYLLEQLRLCLDKRDTLRSELVAKKIRPKQLLEPGWKRLRVRYHILMVRLHITHKDYLATARSYKAIYDALVPADKPINVVSEVAPVAPAAAGAKPAAGAGKSGSSATAAGAAGAGGAKAGAAGPAEPVVEEDCSDLPVTWRAALQLAIVYGVLAPYDYESQELLTRIAQDRRRLHEVPAFKSVLEQYRSKELMRWPLARRSAETAGIYYEAGAVAATSSSSSSMSDDVDGDLSAIWKAESAFTEDDSAAAAASSSSSSSAAGAAAGRALPAAYVAAKRQTRWELLARRVVQHNIRVVAESYSAITTARLATLLGLPADAAEEHVAELVSQKQLAAKIDRPKGVISFRPPQPANATLQAWSDDVARLLEMVETASHLIHRENMVHKVVSKVV